MYSELIYNELNEAAAVLQKFIQDQDNIRSIQAAAQLIAASLKAEGKVISCGNGGSHCDAMHFAEELTGRYRENRRPLGALALGDSSHVTCVGNDYGFKYIFARQVEGLGRPGDVLIGISTSGKSENVIL